MKKILDCRGLQCPLPVTRCREILEQDDPYELSILVDNPASLENTRRFMSRNGFEVSDAETGDQEWRLECKKICESSGVAPVPQNRSINKTVVLLTTETLGRGDDELGRKLMATFLATLADISPWRVILLNGAVKLSATSGDALESLKKLSDNGSELLVCGACLNHYGLLDRKAVGETTNMMDVVASLGIADRVIRP